MPEERKPAPLPPEPWKAETEWPWAVTDADGKQIACVYHPAVRDLLLCAPALEKERDAAIRCRDTYQATAVDFREERNNARALLHDLTAAVRALDGEIPYTTGWKRSRETMMILLRLAESLLRRAEADAAMENANG